MGPENHVATLDGNCVLQEYLVAGDAVHAKAVVVTTCVNKGQTIAIG